VKWVDELRAAIATGTTWRRWAGELPPPVRAAGLAFLPIVGGVVGALAAVAAAIGATWTPLAGAVMAIVVLEGLAGRRVTGATSVVVALKAAAVAVVPTAGRVPTLVLAPALARWAVVVQCYGGRPALASDASPLVGRARFREFGVASVTAIGGALAALDALGLLAVLGAALATVGLRIVAYRRGTGLGERALERTETVVEAVVLLILAAAVSAMRMSRPPGGAG
jgi:hypothetical protein